LGSDSVVPQRNYLFSEFYSKRINSTYALKGKPELGDELIIILKLFNGRLITPGAAALFKSSHALVGIVLMSYFRARAQ
jgi:hypothetical protein